MSYNFIHLLFLAYRFIHDHPGVRFWNQSQKIQTSVARFLRYSFFRWSSLDHYFAVLSRMETSSPLQRHFFSPCILTDRFLHRWKPNMAGSLSQWLGRSWNLFGLVDLQRKSKFKPLHLLISLNWRLLKWHKSITLISSNMGVGKRKCFWKAVKYRWQSAREDNEIKNQWCLVLLFSGCSITGFNI